MSFSNSFNHENIVFLKCYITMLNCKHKINALWPLTINCQLCEYNDVCSGYETYKTTRSMNYTLYLNKDENINKCHAKYNINDCNVCPVKSECQLFLFPQMRKSLAEKYERACEVFDYACPECQNYYDLDSEYFKYAKKPNCKTCPKALNCEFSPDILVHELFLELDKDEEYRRTYEIQMKDYIKNKKPAEYMYYIRGMRYVGNNCYEFINKKGQHIFTLNNDTGSIYTFEENINVNNNNNTYNNSVTRNAYTHDYSNDIDREYLKDVLNDGNDYEPWD